MMEWSWSVMAYWDDLELTVDHAMKQTKVSGTISKIMKENSTTVKELLQETTSSPHMNSNFEYEWVSPTPMPLLNHPDSEDSDWKQDLIDYFDPDNLAEEIKIELIKDTIGAGLIALGTFLAQPDPVAGPIDEVVGVALIWIGRIIRIA